MFASRRVVCILTMVMAFDGWLRSVSTVHAAEPAKQPQRWAILVGVDDYVYVKDLNFCVADQEALAGQLVASGFPQDQVFLLADKVKEQKYRPSKSNIETQLNLLLTMVEKGDTLLLSFSGHGVHIDGHSYLCPSDAKLEDPKGTMVSLDQVYDDLAKCPAGMKLMLVDACRNDPRLGGERSLDPDQSRRGFGESLETPPQGISLLTSCSPGQFAREDAELGHGVFVHFLLEGLQGKAADEEGTVSLMRLADYTSRETKKYVARKFVAAQTPYFRGEVSGLVELAHIKRSQLLPKAVPSTEAKAAPSIKLDPGLERKLVQFDEKLRIDPQDWLAYNDRGAAWHDHGDYDKAIADFTEALRISPDAETYSNLASSWECKKEYEKALVNYAEAIRLSPKNASYYTGRANTLNDLKRYDKAIENLNYAIWLDPKLARAYKYRGDAFGGKKESDKAIADYTEAVRLDPKLLWAFKCRGDLWLEKREFDKAIADFDKTIRLDPTLALAYAQRGYLWVQKGQYDNAIADESEAIRLNLKSPEVYDNRATAWDGKGEYDKAIADYGEAIRLDPEEPLYFYNRGGSWYSKEDYQKAIDDYTEALWLRPHYVDALSNRGFARLYFGEHDKAFEDFEEVIRLDPKIPAVYSGRGEVWVAKVDFDKAIADFGEAIRLDRKYTIAYKNRGNAWLSKGNSDKAIADYSAALRIDPKYAIAYCQRGHARTRKGEYVQAIADCDQAIRLDPKSAIPHRVRGEALEKQGKYSEAIAGYTEAIRLNSSYVKAYASLASLLATCPAEKLRDGKRAVELATKSADLDGAKTAEPMAALAAAHAEIGDFEQAVKWQTKAIDLVTDENDKRLAKARLELYESGQPFRLVTNGSAH